MLNAIGSKCGTWVKEAANWRKSHPKTIIGALVTLAAVGALIGFMAHGAPLSGIGGRMLLVGTALAGVGAAYGTYKLKNKETAASEGLQAKLVMDTMAAAAYRAKLQGGIPS